jgi:hypothetical protein|tara:strand:- start:16 stop:267 length:252 start_codon:yes stop_codon:yes gene_type:complete
MQDKSVNYSTARIYTETLARLRVLATNSEKTQIKMIDELVTQAWIDLTSGKTDNEIDILDSEHLKFKSGIENAVPNSSINQGS